MLRYSLGVLDESKTRTNSFKIRLLRGDRLLGVWTGLSSPTVAEIYGAHGFDWMVIDCEHAPNDLPDVLGQLRALQPYPTEPVVRLVNSQPATIRRFLDIGVRTFLLPMIETAEQARDAVTMTRYPPEGRRGVATIIRANEYGQIHDYLSFANENICIICQIETRQAVENLASIANVEGVDALFVGPSDLSADLGYLGNPSHAEVQGVVAGIVEETRRLKIPIATLCRTPDQARDLFAAGFQFLSVGSDLHAIVTAAAATREVF
jgi:4-hydroxy-2-oxoheptanedioate aldolase